MLQCRLQILRFVHDDVIQLPNCQPQVSVWQKKPFGTTIVQEGVET